MQHTITSYNVKQKMHIHVRLKFKLLNSNNLFALSFYIDHGWDLTLKSMFPDESDLERAEVLDFGVGHDHLMNIMLHDHGGSPIPDKGIQSLTKVLHAARDSLGLEFCPLLPDVACLLLSYMPVSSNPE